ncbi:DegT/DnrJ/EryC1/StrS family aminotransferase [Candidatus Woesearchaeota archaeon]|nr:DegT/DnrJ/EryC1/StrS family aminotransferase [Candidatus Woesearchaeota archaeon]
MIPLFKPCSDEEEIRAVAEALKSGWWGLGPKTKEFEEKFAEYIGTKYAVCLNSATAALHLSLKALDLPEGSEVITTPISFISTSFAAHYNNLKPVFADVSRDTLNLDPEDVRRKITPKTKAIMPVHFGGHICDIEELTSIASEHSLAIVEDAAHAAGSEFNGKKAGSFGKFGCFSFHAVKNLATGDGGMVTTNDKKAYERLVRLRWLGIDKSTFSRTLNSNYTWDYDVRELGFKCHGNDILSSIGIVQLKKLESTNKRRREIFKEYNDALKDVVETPSWRKGHISACHNYVAKADDRDSLIAHLNANGISAGVHYKPLYLHSYYKGLKADCPVSDEVWQKMISLPLFPDLKEKEIRRVISCIKEFYGK